MINLLPDTLKSEIKAGRMNVILLRYNLLMAIALGVVIGLCVLFYVILFNAQSNAVNASKDNAAKAASYASVRAAADEYRMNLSIANTILDNSVNYTSVIFAITKLLPDDVILDNITINATDFGQQTSFAAHAKSYAKATELKENFQNSKLFSNVFFENLTDSSLSGDVSSSTYPIAVTISAKLNKGVL